MVHVWGAGQDASINEIIQFKSSVTDISRVDPFEDEFHIKVQEEVEMKGGKGKKRKPPVTDKPGEDVEKESFLALPHIVPVKQDEWEKHNFNKESALKVIDNGEEGYDFFINMDNIHLLTEQKVSSSIDPKLLDARYKYGMVLLGIALLRNCDDVDKKTSDDEEEDTLAKISEVTKAVSPVLLPMIASLGDLEIESEGAVFQED